MNFNDALKKMIQFNLDAFTSKHSCGDCRDGSGAMVDVMGAFGEKPEVRVFCCCESYESFLKPSVNKIAQACVDKLIAEANGG